MMVSKLLSTLAKSVGALVSWLQNIKNEKKSKISLWVTLLPKLTIGETTC